MMMSMIVEDNTKLIRPRGQDVAFVKGLCENTKISCEINHFFERFPHSDNGLGNDKFTGTIC